MALAVLHRAFTFGHCQSVGANHAHTGCPHRDRLTDDVRAGEKYVTAHGVIAIDGEALLDARQRPNDFAAVQSASSFQLSAAGFGKVTEKFHGFHVLQWLPVRPRQRHDLIVLIADKGELVAHRHLDAVDVGAERPLFD